MPPRRVLALSAGGLGLVLGAAGTVVLSSRAAAAPVVGWFAYAPPGEDPLAGVVVVDEVRAAGVALVTVGLALVAFTVGLLAHARARRGVAVVAALATAAGVVAVAVPRAAVVAGGGRPRHGPEGGPAWSFPTLLWAPVQVAGAAVALLGVVVLAGVLGASLRPRTRA